MTSSSLSSATGLASFKAVCLKGATAVGASPVGVMTRASENIR